MPSQHVNFVSLSHHSTYVFVWFATHHDTSSNLITWSLSGIKLLALQTLVLHYQSVAQMSRLTHWHLINAGKTLEIYFLLCKPEHIKPEVRLNVSDVNAQVLFSWEELLKIKHRKSKLSLLKINMQIILPTKPQFVHMHFVRSLLRLF